MFCENALVNVSLSTRVILSQTIFEICSCFHFIPSEWHTHLHDEQEIDLGPVPKIKDLLVLTILIFLLASVAYPDHNLRGTLYSMREPISITTTVVRNTKTAGRLVTSLTAHIEQVMFSVPELMTVFFFLGWWLAHNMAKLGRIISWHLIISFRNTFTGRM